MGYALANLDGFLEHLHLLLAGFLWASEIFKELQSILSFLDQAYLYLLLSLNERFIS
jgi:hypothetical protein